MAKKGNTKSNKKVNNKVDNKKVIEEIPVDESIKHGIKVAAAVLVIFGLVYLFTVNVTKNSTDLVVKKRVENTSIQYDEILAGTSFNQQDNEYLVLYFDVENDKDSKYYSLKNEYEQKENKLPIYYVDLGSVFNKYIVSDEATDGATSAEELKVTNPTLIKFSNGAISEFITGEEDITNYLK